MTGTRIKTLLEDALLTAIINDKRFRGGFPYTSGLRYRVDPLADRGNRVYGCEVTDDSGAWQALENYKVYRVVVNSFMAGDGDGYKAFTGLTGLDTSFIDTQAFLEYVSEKKTPSPCTVFILRGNFHAGIHVHSHIRDGFHDHKLHRHDQHKFLPQQQGDGGIDAADTDHVEIQAIGMPAMAMTAEASMDPNMAPMP